MAKITRKCNAEKEKNSNSIAFVISSYISKNTHFNNASN